MQQTCGVKDPITLDDCKNDSSKNSVCCYAQVSLINSTQTLCVYVPNTQVFITPFVSSMDIGLSPDNIKIKLDCGFKPGDIPVDQPYSICLDNPQSPEECYAKSNTNASCCYISNPDNTSVCLLNNGIYKKDETYFGIKVSCLGMIISMNYLSLLLMIIALII